MLFVCRVIFFLFFFSFLSLLMFRSSLGLLFFRRSCFCSALSSCFPSHFPSPCFTSIPGFSISTPKGRWEFVSHVTILLNSDWLNSNELFTFCHASQILSGSALQLEGFLSALAFVYHSCITDAFHSDYVEPSSHQLSLFTFWRKQGRRIELTLTVSVISTLRQNITPLVVEVFCSLLFTFVRLWLFGSVSRDRESVPFPLPVFKFLE